MLPLFRRWKQKVVTVRNFPQFSSYHCGFSHLNPSKYELLHHSFQNRACYVVDLTEGHDESTRHLGVTLTLWEGRLNLRPLIKWPGYFPLHKEGYIQEVRSERKRQIAYDHLHVESKIQHKWTYLWNRNTHKVNRLVVAMGVGGWRRSGLGVWGYHANYYTEWVNKVLLFNIQS